MENTNTIKEQIKSKIEQIEKLYDYNWEGTKTATFCVRTHDGFECELEVEITKVFKAVVKPQFGYLEIEGDIFKNASCERDMNLIKEFNDCASSFRKGLRMAVEEMIGIKNPNYNPKGIFRSGNTFYTNEREIHAKVEEMFNKVYTIKHEEEYEEIRFKDYAIRMYVLKDMSEWFCQEYKVAIPINYKNK